MPSPVHLAQNKLQSASPARVSLPLNILVSRKGQSSFLFNPSTGDHCGLLHGRLISLYSTGSAAQLTQYQQKLLMQGSVGVVLCSASPLLCLIWSSQ